MQFSLSKLTTLLLFLQWQVSSGQTSMHDLYLQKSYFQLRRTFNAQYRTIKQPDRLFYQAVLDNAFNRPQQSDRAIVLLHGSFTHLLTDSLRKALLYLEADNAIKMYHYQKATAIFRAIIDQCKIDSAERADLENSIALWGAVANEPPQEVMQDKTVVLHWHKDTLGLVQLPVHTGTDTCDLVFDTGANISVITESSAKKLQMRICPVSLDLGAGTTGQTVKSSLAVADSLWLGSVLLRHVVFLLLPDDMLFFKQIGYRQQGIIGEPVMAQLRQLTFYGDGRLEIPLKPVSTGLGNLALDGVMPVVEYEIEGQHLPFRLDCGTSTSVLYAPFYHRFKNFVTANGEPYQLRTGGVGGTINTTNAFKLLNVAIKVANKTFTIPEINVRTTQVGRVPDLFYGNMGFDMFGRFKQVTINFKAMSFEVN